MKTLLFIVLFFVSSIVTGQTKYPTKSADSKENFSGEKPVFNPPNASYEEISLTDSSDIKLSNLTSSKFIKVKPATYRNVSLYSFEELNNVVLDLTGAVFENCTFIFGKGKGLKIFVGVIKDTHSRVLKFSFELNDFQIYNTNFINCGDYIISASNVLNYDGGDETLNKGFKIMNCSFTNCGPITTEGELNDKNDSGLFKDIEIAYNTFKNSPHTGKVFEGRNLWNYSVHHNVVDSINQQNNNHNGVFELQGNGKFHSNRFTNYQGNSIRAWLFSRGTESLNVEIYNNICYNTRKYSGFEVQEMKWLIQDGKTTFANAFVYNNTVGVMNTSKSWEGQLLDLYQISGSLEFYNNLGFNLNRAVKPVTDMINYNGNAAGGMKRYNNIYKPNYEQAILDLNLNIKELEHYCKKIKFR